MIQNLSQRKGLFPVQGIENSCFKCIAGIPAPAAGRSRPVVYGPLRLFTDAELFDQLPVPVDILVLQVV